MNGSSLFLQSGGRFQSFPIFLPSSRTCRMSFWKSLTSSTKARQNLFYGTWKNWARKVWWKLFCKEIISSITERVGSSKIFVGNFCQKKFWPNSKKNFWTNFPNFFLFFRERIRSDESIEGICQKFDSLLFPKNHLLVSTRVLAKHLSLARFGGRIIYLI